MEDVVVGSWQELNERLYEDTWQPDLERYRSRFAFRGVADVALDLSPGLLRLTDEPEVEAHLLRSFRRYARREAVDDSIWNWLALAQHHGLPTRLLDWTYSPYVALHFATASPERGGCDSAVWCIDFTRINAFLPEHLRGLLAEEGTMVFTAELLDRAARSLPELDALAPEPFVLFLEPPSLDDRIVNQYALFSLLSSGRARLDEWLRWHPDAFRRIVIPAALSWEVRDKLDQANITERVLFPGLDGLSRWLARYYMRRPTGRSGGADGQPTHAPDRRRP